MDPLPHDLSGVPSVVAGEPQYVATVRNASVCDSEGDVWDGAGNLYRMNTWVRHPVHKLEVRTPCVPPGSVRAGTYRVCINARQVSQHVGCVT